MYLRLHLIFLFFKLFSDIIESFLFEFLLTELFFDHSIGIFEPSMFVLQEFDAFFKLVDLQLDIGVLLINLSVIVVFVSQLTM